VKRTKDGGKGYTGVVAKGPDYVNPFLEALEKGRT
jgi:beta-lysine 5,6-aminomutase alpha subunit